MYLKCCMISISAAPGRALLTIRRQEIKKAHTRTDNKVVVTITTSLLQKADSYVYIGPLFEMTKLPAFTQQRCHLPHNTDGREMTDGDNGYRQTRMESKQNERCKDCIFFVGKNECFDYLTWAQKCNVPNIYHDQMERDDRTFISITNNTFHESPRHLTRGHKEDYASHRGTLDTKAVKGLCDEGERVSWRKVRQCFRTIIYD